MIRDFIKSFRYAIRGVLYTFRNERNFKIESVVAIFVFVAMIFLPLSGVEISILFLTIGWVLSLELINTALERMTDIVKPNVHPYVKVVKDVVAGAVLIAAVFSVCVGGVIFAPYIIGSFFF